MKKKRRRPINSGRKAKKPNAATGVDPRTLFQAPAVKGDRKNLQLAKQVQRTIELTLGDFGDDILGGLLVESVMPAPDASQLLVTVRPMLPDDAATVADTLSALGRVTSQLRTEISRSISRKKTPRLMFQVVAAPVTPTSVAEPATDHTQQTDE